MSLPAPPGNDPDSTAVPAPGAGRGLPLSLVLLALANDASRGRIRIQDLFAALGDRAIGALMFVFAVPNVVPVPPGVSAVLGTPLIFLAAQLMTGRGPWLPAVVAQRSLPREDFARLMDRVLPWLMRGEKLLRPRLGVWVRPPMEYLVGAICLLLAVVLVLPIPLGNTLPALAISVLALGVLERDGLWVLAGLVAATVAVAVVSGVVLAVIKAGLFVLQQWLA
ncbi:MAG: exopolysaccharide biosynthesis protein [Hydrogenophaga sp.]|jgi:hypothetical protein|nr:exopolysaccharide biosynthesis protein [Hydrogenophaga sp.]